jgi:hypothetical protein
MYVSSAVETVISVQSTATKALGTTTALNLQDFDMSANNRLKYVAQATSHFVVTVALSMTAAGNNQLTTLSVAKNGTNIASSEVQRFIGTGADLGAAAVATIVELAQDDYLELFVANETGTGNLTVELMNFIVSEVG